MFKTIWGYLVWAVLTAVLSVVFNRLWTWAEKKWGKRK